MIAVFWWAYEYRKSLCQSFRSCKGCLRGAHIYQRPTLERFGSASDRSFSSDRKHHSVSEADEDEVAGRRGSLQGSSRLTVMIGDALQLAFVGEQQLGTARLLLHKELGGSVTGNGQCRPKGDWLDGGCRCFRGAFAGFCGDQLRLCFFTVPATAIVRPPCEYQSQWHSDTKRRLHACAVKSSFTLEHVTLLHYFTRI